MSRSATGCVWQLCQTQLLYHCRVALRELSVARFSRPWRSMTAGPDRFLEKYGFGAARSYWLVVDGKTYEKARLPHSLVDPGDRSQRAVSHEIGGLRRWHAKLNRQPLARAHVPARGRHHAGASLARRDERRRRLAIAPEETPRRAVFCMFGLGINGRDFTPAETGQNYTVTPILKPLEGLRATSP